MSGAGKGAVIPNVVITLDNSASMSAQWQGENRGVRTFKSRTIYELRSSRKNPRYYNPKKYYAPRLGADGTPYTHPTAWADVGKWGNTTFNDPEEDESCFDKNKFDESKNCTDRSPWAANPKMQFLVNWDAEPSGGKDIMYTIAYDYSENGEGKTPLNDGYHRTSSGHSFAEQAITPRHREYNNLGEVTDKQSFRYVVCKTKDDKECWKENGATNHRQVVDIFKDTITITTNGKEKHSNASTVSMVPASIVGNNRPDCKGGGANGCTRAEEMANIIRWYNFYASSIKSVTTAIGNAMANKKFNHKLRLGFNRMHWRDRSGSFALHKVFNYDKKAAAKKNFDTRKKDNYIDRGVRYWKDDDNKTEFYDWLYQIDLVSTTPSHEAINRVANYYRTHGPWKTDPTSKEAVVLKGKNKDLDCRRAYHIFLADGGWNWKPTGPARCGKTVVKNRQGGEDEKDDCTKLDTGNEMDNWKYSVNLIKRQAEKFTRKDGSEFAYSYKGNPRNPSEYIPYASKETDRKLDTDGTSLSDLTAFYFWNFDFSKLPNNVAPIPSRYNPTFWQNMTSFHLGWGLKPGINNKEDGKRKPGFTWESLKNYQNTWLQGAPEIPNWDIGKFSTDNTSHGADYSHTDATVNDFIRAAYTGGGEAFSVYTPEDVERAITYIISLITSSGDDAGVAVSGSGGSTEDLDKQLRYSVSYETASNSGSIMAYNINSTKVKGKTQYSVGKPEWAATAAPVKSRKLYTLSGTVSRGFIRPTLDYQGNNLPLPTDLKGLLNKGASHKDDLTFIRYILGEDDLADKEGKQYRTRVGGIGASVNSPPAFVGAGLNMGYSSSAVTGNSGYKQYLEDKKNGKPTIFAATNEGIVHVLNAGKKDEDGGKEVAAYMPKGAMAHQVDLADSKFQFKYVLDGPLAVDDLYHNTWKQVVIGTGGRGGKYAYAINAPFDNDRTPKEKDFLWEVSSANTDYADMGYITNLSTAGQLQDGTWVTLMNSGHYAGTGKVGLYVIEALTGKLKYFVQIPHTDATGNRGLGGVVAVRNKKREIVAAYAGDFKGNVWRFDLRTERTDKKANNPAKSEAKLLFNTGSKRPIYAAPAWQVHPKGGVIVNVATGILLDESDVTKWDRNNAIYGLWDPTEIGGDDDSLIPIKHEELLKHELDLISATPLPTIITPGDDNTIVTIKYVDEKDVSQTVVSGKDKHNVWSLKQTAPGVTIQKNTGVITIPPKKIKDGTLQYSGNNSDDAKAKIGTTTDEGTIKTDAKGNVYYRIKKKKVIWKEGSKGEHRGWYLETGKVKVDGVGSGGERVIGDLNYLGSAVLVSSVFVPNQNKTVTEDCNSSSLANMLYVIDAVTGNPTKFFREFGASAVFLPAGGFTRGLVVRKTSGDPIIGKTNEGYPDGKAKKCSPGQFAVVGAGGIMQGDLICASSWTRSWRSIVNSPFN